MARFHKLFGGLELAGNGMFKNLVVEQLDKDPANVTHGRIWYNTNENVCKYSKTEKTVDKDGKEQSTIVTRVIGTAEDLSKYMEDIASTAADKGASLVGFNGKTGANGKFALPAQDGQKTFGDLVDAVDNDRKTIEDAAALAHKETKEVQDELDKTQDGAGLNKDGSYKADSNSNFLKDAKSLADADSKLDDSLKSLGDKEEADIKNTKNYVDTNFFNKTSKDTQSVEAPVSFAKDVVVNGNLTIKSGKVTEVETEQLKIADNIITLNSDVPADKAPTENSGIEINRGKEGVMPLVIWNEKDKVAQVVTGKDSNGNYEMASIATGGDADAIQKELNGTEKGAGLNDDGSYAANDKANYIAKATSLADADNKLDGSLKALDDREAADTKAINDKADGIQKELDGTQKGAGLADNGSYSANDKANYIKDATSLADADNKLDSQAKTNADNITKEVQDRKDAVKKVQDELDKTQTGAGLADDGSYVPNDKANYIKDATSLAGADNKLDSQVKVNADNIEANKADTANLKKDLNNTRVVYEAKDAATSYTITHNLGSQFVDVMIWVYDSDDSKWYNDSTVVSVVDDNNIQVDLTSAAKIRATIVNVSHQF